MWNEVMAVLRNIENYDSETRSSYTAIGLRKNLNTFEIVFIMVYWNTLLERFFQFRQFLDLAVVFNIYKSLIELIINLKMDEMLKEFIEKAKKQKNL